MTAQITENTTTEPTAEVVADAQPVEATAQVVDVAAYETGTTVHVSPTVLLLDKNIREAQPDAPLIRSVKEVGVLEPIVAVLTADGDLRCRFGARRTLAAIQAERNTVPVYIAARENDTTDKAMSDKAEARRIIEQRDENTHRAGLTVAEEVGVVEQLTLLGLSAGQIARQARIKKADVETALTVVASPMAKEHAQVHVDLTLDQAAVLAEFEDDPETVIDLVNAANTGDFDHVAQEARDERTSAAYTAGLMEALTAAGVRMVDGEALPSTYGRLNNYKATEDADEPLNAETHVTCPGHVAYLTEAWVWIDAEGQPAERRAEGAREIYASRPVYGCEDPATHGHVDRWAGTSQEVKPKAADMTDEQRAEAQAARRLVIDNNKAWASAETVRREWLAAFAQRKTAPKGTAAFIAEAIALDLHHLFDYQATPAVEWLGAKDKRQAAKATEGTTENRALVVALVQVLGLYEHKIDKAAWRQDGKTSQWGRYLRFLESAGYALSDVEKYAVSSKTA